MRALVPLLLILSLALAACSTPGQTDPVPCGVQDAERTVAGAGGVVGGQRPTATATTGDSRGVPNPLGIYGRGPITGVTHTFDPESRTAGTIANPKAWTADSTQIASAPMAAKCLAEWAEVLAIDYARTTDPEHKANLRADMLVVATKIQTTQAEYIGAIAALAPKFTNCVLFQLDLSGSSAGGQDAVDPENSEAAAGGAEKLLERGLATVRENAAASRGTPSNATGEESPNPPAGPGGVPDPTPDPNGGG